MPSDPPEAMVALEGVCVEYDGVLAVDDVSLSLPRGEVLAVLGPSGCGKSTLLRAVAGLEPLSAGRVLAEGEDLHRTPTHKRGFALMFQDGQLFAHLSVARNVGYALRLRRRPTAEVTSRVEELLALVGLEGFADRLPGTLSGGERQRVALARALAVQPRLLLLDEPLSALDAGLRERLAVDLRDILQRAGTTAWMVTHDHEEAFTVADRMAVMRAGRVVQEGAIGDVWAAPVDRETALFLGYARVLEGAAAATVTSAVTNTAVTNTAGTTAAGEALADAGAVAVRRSALVADHDGRLHGVVREARATPDRVRLVVDVDGAGELDAVAPTGSGLGPGEQVRLRVDVSRLARVSK